MDKPVPSKRRRGMTLKELCEEFIPSQCERDEEGCLIWQGCRNLAGYGSINHEGKNTSPHRVMLIYKTGEDRKGMDAGHLCGRGYKGCVDPEHLAWQTRQENIEQSLTTGRKAWDLREKWQLRQQMIRELEELRAMM